MILHPGKPVQIPFYFSFRSPYAYLAAPRVFALEQHFHVTVDYRGVVPIVERGGKVPFGKLVYIVRDAAREAQRLGMSFGRIFDPVGRGTQRCLAIAEMAKAIGRERDFVIRVSRAIWAEGADVGSDRRLSRLCEEVGLSWSDCQQAIASREIRDVLEGNRESLAAAGHWGVPSMIFDGQVYWGQDRIRYLELALAEAGLSTAARIGRIGHADRSHAASAR